MATLAAVDLGAQSGRVALGRFDGARLDVAEVHRFANVPVQVAGTAAVGRAPPLRATCWTACARPPARRRRSTRSASTRGASTSGCSTRRARSLQNPVHYRDARRAARGRSVLAQVPPRELYERTGIQLLPINTIFELAAMAAERRPRAGGAPRRCC